MVACKTKIKEQTKELRAFDSLKNKELQPQPHYKKVPSKKKRVYTNESDLGIR